MDDNNLNDPNNTEGNLGSTPHSFPVIGIGASAGGLDAFERFFKEMPPNAGMAFVIIQHLDPTRESMLVELLQRYTYMPVQEITDGIRVEPDNVYVIPPNTNTSFNDGRLQLLEPTERRYHRLPIDFFFRSLAEDQRHRAIAILLSGTGSDGTLGIKAIKEQGGMAMVQDPMSAQHAGMPESAMRTNIIDFVDEPEMLPKLLINYINQFFEHSHSTNIAKFSDYLPKVYAMVSQQLGHDFSQYKENTIIRRIQHRMAIKQIKDISSYTKFLHDNPEEIEYLFREFLIGVTHFFRDQEAFDALRDLVIPNLWQERNRDEIRVWVPGCSTGEEAYSIAILIHSHMLRTSNWRKIQIFATDIDEEALDIARRGMYAKNIVSDVPEEYLKRYFVDKPDQYRIVDDIRDMVIFATQSIIKDPPFSHVDLISCRNLLIYLGATQQKRVVPMFHYALRPRGYLFLGAAESLNGFDNLFSPVVSKQKIFRRLEGEAVLNTDWEFFSRPRRQKVSQNPDENPRRQSQIENATQRLILQEFTPTYVVVDDQGEIVHFHYRTGRYLQPAAGAPTNNLLQMAREGLKLPLTTALNNATRQRQRVVKHNVRFVSEGRVFNANIIVEPIVSPGALQGLYMIIFEEVLTTPRPAGDATEEFEEVDESDAKARVRFLESELQTTRQYLQTTIEELEYTNEELQSSNEELQSSNEELQSTNEELETAKEELQSINEELVTVNNELGTKIELLSHANSDLQNLLASIEIGIVFLDSQFTIQRFNRFATKLLNLIEADHGRPIEHITGKLRYSDFREDAEKVLETLIPLEKEVATTDGHWYVMGVRPYRTVDNVISGVVITFSEITEQKSVQEEMKQLSMAVEQSSSMVTIVDRDSRINYVNPSLLKRTGYEADEILGRSLRWLKSTDPSHEVYEEMWHCLTQGESWSGEMPNEKKSGEIFWTSVTASPVTAASSDEVAYFLLIEDDITDKKVISEVRAHLAAVVEYSRDAIITLNPDGTITHWNQGAAQIYGYTSEEVLGHSIRMLMLEHSEDFEFDQLEKIKQGQKVESYDTQRLIKSGHIRYFSVNLSPIYNDKQELVAVVTVERDLSERRQLEEALQLTKERFHAALKGTPVVVFNQDRDLEYTWIYNTTTGFTDEQIIGKQDSDLFGTPEQVTELEKIKKSVMESGEGSRQKVSVTYFNGKETTFDFICEPLRDARGEITGVTCVALELPQPDEANA